MRYTGQGLRRKSSHRPWIPDHGQNHMDAISLQEHLGQQETLLTTALRSALGWSSCQGQIWLNKLSGVQDEVHTQEAPNRLLWLLCLSVYLDLDLDLDLEASLKPIAPCINPQFQPEMCSSW